jgi:hypothetical protein
VHAGDDERRRGDRLPDAEPLSDALGERRLAGPQRTDEDDEVPRAQLAGQRAPERPGVVGGGEGVLELHDRLAATAVRSASSPARGAPFGPNRIAAEGW